MDIERLQEFLQWCLIVNAGIYLFSVVAILGLRDFTSKMHTKLFRVSEEVANKVIYQYLAMYKLLLIVFNLVPWIAIQFVK